MKSKLHRLLLSSITLVTGIFANAQSGTYFREGFSADSEFPSSAAEAVPPQYRFISNSGTWFINGVYKTSGGTGACATQTGDASHARFANLSAVTSATDSAYLVTPILNAGANTLSFFNGRALRRFSIFKTTDTLATTSNWTLVTLVPLDNAACQATTVTINDASTRRLKMVSRGGTDSDIDSLVVTSVNPILPVRFAGFSAVETSGKVKLHWDIATEVNTSRYVVERSADGRNFTDAATLNANKTPTYSWIDNAPNSGNNFYRIRAVDKDGSAMYTSIVRVTLGLKNPELVITPNPVRGKQLTLQLSNIAAGVYTVKVFNNAGQQVHTTQVSYPAGNSTQVVQLPAGLNKGLYSVVFSGNNVGINKSIVVE